MPDTNPQPLEHWSLYINAGEERYDRVVRTNLAGAICEATGWSRCSRSRGKHPITVIIAKSQEPKRNEHRPSILIALGLAFLIGIVVGIVIQSENGPDYDE
jgi:hypothetical protein